MRKVAAIFVAAVFVPSLVLAWLAFRSLRDQQFVLERQQSLLCQHATDALAGQVQSVLADQQHAFASTVEQLLTGSTAARLAPAFNGRLQTNWPLAEIGFVVSVDGSMLAPSAVESAQARAFRTDNGSFLGNREMAEVYWNINPQAVISTNASVNYAELNSQTSANFAQNSSEFARKTAQVKLNNLRSVVPQQQQGQIFNAGEQTTVPIQKPASRIAPAESGFQQLIGEAPEGTIARFVNNRLQVWFWYRSPRDPGYVFGAQLALPRLVEALRELFRAVDPDLSAQICLALLNDEAKPEARSDPEFAANWKHPFVSTEIGEALPHWEIAAYLLKPDELSRSADTLRLTLGLIIATLVLAIAIGSWLIVSDLNRQLTLARQKTDFVSNVSHELKTPLTSIRMFAELLAEQRVADPAKQRSYLNIITAETARLTRLINNVLDFSRMDRGEKKYHFRDCDLGQLARDTIESFRPHLENNGFHLDTAWPDIPLPVHGDPDALAQVLVNLLSNAEKYSNGAKEIALEARRRDGPLPCAEVRVLDRGPGVPRGCEERIFEKFYRAHESLANGVQGSGLGLTLARQIARAHGGDVAYEPRPGGGSAFCLRLPVRPNPAGHNPDSVNRSGT